jgi:GDP-L-fucose synthase
MQTRQANELGEFVNVGTGADSSIRQIAELVRTVIGFDGTIAWNPAKPDGTPKKLADVSRINALGWTATTALKDGILAAYNDYLKPVSV